jgi:hypothetical protein
MFNLSPWPHFFLSEHGNEDFMKFVSLLGDRISLRGWDKFRAGLDVKGSYSYTRLLCDLTLGANAPLTNVLQRAARLKPLSSIV